MIKILIEKYNEENNIIFIENIFCWAPNEEQWRITGFNPDFSDPNVDEDGHTVWLIWWRK